MVGCVHWVVCLPWDELSGAMVTVCHHLFGQCWEMSVSRASGRMLDCRLELTYVLQLPCMKSQLTYLSASLVPSSKWETSQLLLEDISQQDRRGSDEASEGVQRLS